MDDPYLKESCKSYQKCQVANSARKNSLIKRTLGIENQRKLASTYMDREEKQLRAQLKNMKIEMARNSISKGSTVLTGNSKSPKQPSAQPKALDLVYVEPYPVTFAGFTPRMPPRRSMTLLPADGMRYAARRGRRQSKEFEDLSMNTSTGQLAIPSYIVQSFGSKSNHSSAGSSPVSPRRGLNGSVSSMDSSENVHWPGNPEAIQSVRRPRKSIEQQGKEKVSKLKD